ncbi:MAG: NAD-dependent protein deacylase [Bacteroidaceae bacterium]|nr:NAD-dependent protein deacylase [Bacteroidales bacterium]MBQ3622598.1 NAD-dependent protein deacylase [Bacteroidaceae bacterium]
MRKIVILTGAGMSAESGIATFRGSGGMWNNYPVEQVATPEGFAANPGLVLQFYNERRAELLGAEPNEGHRLVADLEKNNDVVVVTQNVDDLHERAGSTNVIHLHGELMKGCSSFAPNDPRMVRTLTAQHPVIALGDKADDGSQLRPFIVWFGEAVPRMDDAIAALRDIDIFVIIGTSLNVYPAAGLLNFVPADVPVYLIDPNDVQVRGVRQVTTIRKGASEGMRDLLKLIG